jgi:hypothetical protein
LSRGASIFARSAPKPSCKLTLSCSVAGRWCGDVTQQETVSYYEQFGFGPPSDEGALSADGAEALYGHRSAVRAIRMPHQDSDHGLLVRRTDQALHPP